MKHKTAFIGFGTLILAALILTFLPVVVSSIIAGICIVGAVIFIILFLLTKNSTNSQAKIISKIGLIIVISLFAGALISSYTNVTPSHIKTSEKSNGSDSRISKIEHKNNQKAQKIYKDISSDGTYDYLNKLELVQNNGKITGVSIYCDNSLKNADQTTLQHYFSLAAQVGNQTLGKGTNTPYVQVYAGGDRIAKSKLDNNNQMVDMRK